MGKCRIDGAELSPVMDFGNIYFSDFVDNPTDGFRSPLEICICGTCGLVQLNENPDPEKMYRKYWYRSGINESMVRSLRDIKTKLEQYIDLKTNDIILDIGANDGTFLGMWNDLNGKPLPTITNPGENVIRIGIDPARNLKQYYKDKCEHYVEDFFSAENYCSVAEDKAKIITSIAMFYDLPDPVRFVQDVKCCLHERGIWVIQMSYLALMLEQNAFDNVCHEHIEYYTLSVLSNLLRQSDFRIIDVELNDVNSGSLRVYVTHKENNVTKLSKHGEMLGQFRLKSLLKYEWMLHLDQPQPYAQFFNRVNKEKEKTLDLLSSLKLEGKLVIGYGASTKGATLLQYYGITPELLPAIAERSKEKVGKVCVGSGIPIISEEEMREMKPDFLFIFPWHFVNQFKEREKILRDSGTKFIVPLPTLEIV